MRAAGMRHVGSPLSSVSNSDHRALRSSPGPHKNEWRELEGNNCNVFDWFALGRVYRPQERADFLRVGDGG